MNGWSPRKFAVATDPPARGCAGRDGDCRKPVTHVAVLTLCTCKESAWRAHQHYGIGHEPDSSIVALCGLCASVVATWPSLSGMRPWTSTRQATA